MMVLINSLSLLLYGIPIISSYRMVLGMMQEDVDFFIKRMDELVDEYAKDIKLEEVRERMNGMLRQMLLSQEQLREKYGIK